jgi:hypothetical protein
MTSEHTSQREAGFPKPIFEKYQFAIPTYFAGKANIKKPVAEITTPTNAKPNKKSIFRLLSATP